MTRALDGIAGFFAGLSYPLRGMRFVFVRHRGLARYWLVPVLLVFSAMGLLL